MQRISLTRFNPKHRSHRGDGLRDARESVKLRGILRYNTPSCMRTTDLSTLPATVKRMLL